MGLLWGTGLLAEVCAALGDWPRAVMLHGVVETVSERSFTMAKSDLRARPIRHTRAIPSKRT